MIDNRILGAMAIAFAGVLVGFATGRLSAWLVPPSGLTSLGSTARPSVPLEPATAPKQLESATSGTTSAAADTRPTLPIATDAQEPDGTRGKPKQADAPDNTKPASGVTSRALSPGEQQGGPGQGGPMWTDADTRLINPGSTQKPEDQREWADQNRPSSGFSEGPDDGVRTLASSSEGLERCRLKYRSFDPADGTYKPYGQDTRVPCPYLR